MQGFLESTPCRLIGDRGPEIYTVASNVSIGDMHHGDGKVGWPVSLIGATEEVGSAHNRRIGTNTNFGSPLISRFDGGDRYRGGYQVQKCPHRCR